VFARVRVAVALLGLGILLFMATNIYTIGKATVQITSRLSAFIGSLRRDTALLSEERRLLTLDGAGAADELQTLKAMFLNLLEEVRRSHVDIVEVQAQRNALEMELLQSRLNPHLLYNSLGVVRWSAMRTGDNRTVRIINALTSYYRRVLARGESLVRVSDELESLRQYILILNLTHEEDYHLEVDTTDGVSEMLILKQLLQPLVENAVLHGLKNREGTRRVSVKGRLEDGDIVLEVADNGYGIDPEKLQKIMSMQYTSKYGGFGLRNSMRRIQSHYGNGYGIRIESRPGEGTTVRVRLRAEVNVAHS
jgi:two-component system sensor histidine kinase YesM